MNANPINWERVNVSGSSMAAGHPWAATGGRIVTTLSYEMARRNADYGLVSICAAGAMAGANVTLHHASVCWTHQFDGVGVLIEYGLLVTAHRYVPIFSCGSVGISSPETKGLRSVCVGNGGVNHPAHR